MATRWGIVSAGLISNDFVGALKALPEGEHRVVAVAARSLESAKKFASKYGVEKAYGSYDELARDPNVEVVYIGTIQTQHLPVASLMIQAGKHVLCEKPLCMNVKEVKQLIQLAKEKKVFLMEAVWSRFFPVYQELTRRIQSGEIGDVVQVICSFGKSIEDVTRMVRRETGGGATLDLGLYTVQFTTLVMGGDKPQKVLACGHLNDNGVDETISTSLVYSGRRVASLSSTIRGDLPSEGFVIGTKGTIKVNYPMWAPESLESSSGKYESLLPKTGHIFNFENSQGLMYEAVEVRRCLNEGLLESPVMTHKESLTNAEVMEKMRTQVGVKFDQDD
ncbi:trans-1,2-dihydrobenzene-1,2-diol dehydrogenase-like [Homarus americanus]|uniref:trans-1,2-dihydrobenzene-1,2-diol dehydrogenase-like n=1 Tax=Homarus americanus TaxID=6706 RepID=UPI001C49098D|nr:trans-1,2-dihydrobenzene-1,2-diol dehydrogenase-like [Homarus americanus]XP_042216076.1 trans-1,2-dihydrobenzene-1,2-diol dehydrogenase-like [Homarus americanus]